MLRSSFVVFRFGVSVCLQHNMLDNGNPLLSYMMPKNSNQASISEDLKMQSNLRHNLLKKSYTKFISNHPTTLRNACENALQFCNFEVVVKLKIYFQRAQNTMVNPGAETQPKCLLQVTNQSY